MVDTEVTLDRIAFLVKIANESNSNLSDLGMRLLSKYLRESGRDV